MTRSGLEAVSRKIEWPRFGDFKGLLSPTGACMWTRPHVGIIADERLAMRAI